MKFRFVKIKYIVTEIEYRVAEIKYIISAKQLIVIKNIIQYNLNKVHCIRSPYIVIKMKYNTIARWPFPG